MHRTVLGKVATQRIIGAAVTRMASMLSTGPYASANDRVSQSGMQIASMIEL
jgi:hypothetical protein